jgi:phage tail sheath protein FI
MPVSPTYPGVYVQEVPSGVRTIVGVSTSVAMFLGTSKKGPIDRPIQCLNYASFRNRFGEDPTAGRLAQYIKLFFLNGGTNCYVMRIANGATAATVILQNEAGGSVLRLDAKDLGLAGENIRAIVTYNGPQPEVTFNIELFQWETDATGRRTKTGNEIWRNLSMDPASPGYAPDFITQNSVLVDATDLNVVPVPVGTAFGFSLSGRPVGPPGTFQAQWSALLGSAVNTNRFKISIGGSPYVDVDLSLVVVPNVINTFLDAVGLAIESSFVANSINNVKHQATGAPPGSGNFEVRFVTIGSVRRLRIARVTDNGDVFIRPGTPSGGQQDLAIPLMLGTEQGGLEVSGLADRRPAPNGITLHASDPAVMTTLAGSQQQDPTGISLESIIQSTGVPVLQAVNLNLVTTAPADLISLDNITGSVTGHSDGVREKLQMIADAVNSAPPLIPLPPGHVWPWKAEVWGYRLAVRLTEAAPDNFISAGFVFTTATALPAGAFTNNVHFYSVGFGGNNVGLQTSAGVVASDGTAPLAADYDNAYPIIDREVDLFNLMVLPPDAAVAMQNVYGNASVFCQKRRAFLLMDPPDSWTDAQTAAGAVAALRIGLVKDYSAVFFPRVTIDESGRKVNLGPTGAIAGLCARIDGTRGVWKAPAGTEADLRGVLGLERQFSDDENGVLNPKAINTLRVFPNGIVNWGARTNDGSDDNPTDWKYIPVRRIALFIEESLYRGLKWVVFEPNDEPLWAQIRLNVGAFMHNLFRQGAFQGATPRVAYFVKCDSETTTQNDINLGIVNIWVGFAPLKPAEFVILYLQQMAGQIQT